MAWSLLGPEKEDEIWGEGDKMRGFLLIDW